MTIYKRGRIYWYDFWFRGERFQSSTKVKNRRDAEQIENAKKTELAKGEVGISVRSRVVTPKLETAMAEFLEWSATEHKASSTERYRCSGNALIERFGNRRLDQISSEDIEDYIDWRKPQKSQTRSDRKIMPATVNREIACLKALFTYFIKKKRLITINPAHGVKLLTEDRAFHVLTMDEELKYLSECAQPLRDIATIMLETGMRPEEVYRMEKKHLHLDQRFYFIPHGKTKAAKRRIPLTSRVINTLSERVKRIEGQWLFPGEVTGRSILKANAAHTKALKQSGLDHFRLYDLRHTFATRFIEAGGDIRTLADILGHADLRMMSIYSHPTDPHKQSSIARFEEFTQKQREQKPEVPTLFPNQRLPSDRT